MAAAFRSFALIAVALAAAGGASAFSFPRLGKPRPAPSAAAPAPAPPAARLAPGQWPQARSDLAPDRAIRFGALANGMRYAILRNATPAGAVSVRLRIAAGSLMEADEEAGFAHFIEHLAFEGSRNVPSGEMVKVLERHGLSFGADTNATTSFGATIYKLDLPKADDDSIETALMLLRETAGDLTLSDDAIERERGVVLSEARADDTPAWRVFKARLAFILDGQRPPTRFPIGQVATITAARRAQLTAFYQRWYRPDRATLIVVGDVDPAAIEAKIRARFGDWTVSGPAPAEPAPGAVAATGPRTRLVVEAGAPTSIELGWVTPPDLSADSRARRKRELVGRLALAVLNRRLASAAAADDPPYLSAGVFRDDELNAARVTGLLIAVDAQSWQRALGAAEQEQRRAVAYGVRPDELAREIAAKEAELKEAAAGAATRRTTGLADEMTSSLEDAEVQTSPAEDLALFEDTVKGLGADEVSAALKTAFRGSGPLVFMSSPITIEGGEAAVRTAYVNSSARAVDAPAITTAVNWPYADFGDPSKVAAQKEIPDLDAVFVTFANGVRLTVKPTRFHDDQVLVKVREGSGLEALPADRQADAWASRALIDGGLGRISLDDAQRALGQAVFGAEARAEDDAFTLSGATRRDDLEAQLQVLAAYVADPAWRPEGFARARATTTALIDASARTDGGVLERELPGLLHAGDRRWAFPSRQEISQTTLEDARMQVGAMEAGPIEVVVVGDITVDKAIDAVQRTFGALPARPAPNATPVILADAGRADRAIGLVAWRTDDFLSDPQGARTASLLADVIQLRLTGALGAAQSVVYSPGDGAAASVVWPHWGFLSARGEVPPEQLDGLFADVARIAADLRDRDIPPDELQRVVKARLEAIAKARQTNEYWLASLSGAQTDRRRLDAIRAEQGGYERITPADLRRAAQKYLGVDAGWKLEVKPGGAPLQ
ncbi:MAG TPA: insulinase family protein [Caulobacteraceae bacterium]|nr:insulinase family protein [Caulobacteraceae bacterium]